MNLYNEKENILLNSYKRFMDYDLEDITKVLSFLCYQPKDTMYGAVSKNEAIQSFCNLMRMKADIVYENITGEKYE